MAPTRIWLTQWLCPKRHCAIAALWNPAVMPAADVIAQGEDVFKSGALNRKCGICGEGLTPESRPTAFDTMEEAEKFHRNNEAEQLASRALIELLKNTNRN